MRAMAPGERRWQDRVRGRATTATAAILCGRCVVPLCFQGRNYCGAGTGVKMKTTHCVHFVTG
jgi:hypothetical protein